ncbi:hypothetical protein L1887_01465 [Cichorium endivia]|nr:hypothetical protein L1887_01465 [Cichorium endivia]
MARRESRRCRDEGKNTVTHQREAAGEAGRQDGEASTGKGKQEVAKVAGKAGRQAPPKAEMAAVPIGQPGGKKKSKMLGFKPIPFTYK